MAKSDKPINEVYLKPGDSRLPHISWVNKHGTTLLEWNPQNAELYAQYPERFTKLYGVKRVVTNVILAGTNTNLFGQLKQVGNMMPNGPYYMDGRDGVMTIHNKMVNRPIFKTYTFSGGNGELLTFSAKSKYVKTSVELSRTSDIDPNTKDLDTNYSQVLINPDKNRDYYYNNYLPQYGVGMYSDAWLDMTPEDHVKALMSTVPPQNIPKFRTQKIENKNEVILDVPLYSSQEDAVAAIAANPEITTQEVDAYLKYLKAEYEHYKDPKKASELDNAIHKLDELPSFIIKRKVGIVNRIEIFDGHPLDPEPYMRNPDASYGYRGNPDSQLSSAQASIKRAYEHLSSKENIQVINSKDTEIKGAYGGTYINKREVVYIEYKTLEIPINGAQMLSSEYSTSSEYTTTNGLEERLENQVTAEATVVGDPTLESSMNFQINNVSELFSGVWYSKTVTHKINASKGFTCDIKFTPRDNNYVINRVEAKIVINKAIAEIHQEADKSLVTGAYKRVAQLKQWLYKEYLPNRDKNQSSILRYDAKSGSVYIYDAKKPFTYDNTGLGSKNSGILDKTQDSTKPSYAVDLNKWE